MEHYNIVFEGNVADGYRVEEVKENLAALYKVDVQKIDRLFSKPTVVLKSKLDRDSALKYQKAFLKAGAMCKVKSSGLAESTSPVEEAAPSQTTSNALAQAEAPSLTKHLSNNMIERAAHPTSDSKTEPTSQTKSRKGIGDIIAGVVIIGIGFSYGGSIFLGNPGMLDYFFDGLGIFWIGKGIYKLAR